MFAHGVPVLFQYLSSKPRAAGATLFILQAALWFWYFHVGQNPYKPRIEVDSFTLLDLVNVSKSKTWKLQNQKYQNHSAGQIEPAVFSNLFPTNMY